MLGTRHPAACGQDEGERQIGRGFVEQPGRIRDDDAGVRRRLDIDVVVAHGDVGDDPEPSTSHQDVRTAILDACKLRYRPIMMTSVAFMLGVLPLAFARGAGSEMRQAIGVAVLGGMLGVTIFGIFLTPVFFAIVDRMKGGRIFSHPAVVAAGASAIYLLKLKFVGPMAASIRDALEAGAKRLRGRKPTNPT